MAFSNQLTCTTLKYGTIITYRSLSNQNNKQLKTALQALGRLAPLLCSWYQLKPINNMMI
jgi:hypothetical protein